MKDAIRRHFKAILASIGESRRLEAKSYLLPYLEPKISGYGKVVSFMSLPHELDLSEVNTYLAREGKLCLPKLCKDHLEIYRVIDLEKELILSKKGLLEPSTDLCEKITTFDCILVPALVFDQSKSRVGYGLGCYDKLLAENPNIYTIGVGFREQLFHEKLPKEPHDISVSELSLV